MVPSDVVALGVAAEPLADLGLPSVVFEEPGAPGEAEDVSLL